MDELINEDDKPVTVSVSRKVRQGKGQEYETWIAGISQASARYPGHLGVSVLRPSSATQGEYVIIYRFDSYLNACKWEQSEERAQWLERVTPLVEGEARRKKVTGLEFWFDLPSIPITMAPSKHRMTLVLSIVVYLLVLAVAALLDPVVAELPFWQKLLIVIPIQVVLMTYLVMPAITRYLKRWIYASG